MLDRLKDLWKTHKKLCVTGIAVVIAAGAYVVGGFDVSVDTIVDKVCSLFGGC